MWRASSLALVALLVASPVRAAASENAGVGLQTTFRFEVRVGPSILIAYDDDLSRPVKIGMPEDFVGWHCARAPVIEDKGARVGGYTCGNDQGYILKLAVVWCSTTWVDKQSTTATLMAPTTTISLATQCETHLRTELPPAQGRK